MYINLLYISRYIIAYEKNGEVYDYGSQIIKKLPKDIQFVFYNSSGALVKYNGKSFDDDIFYNTKRKLKKIGDHYLCIRKGSTVNEIIHPNGSLSKIICGDLVNHVDHIESNEKTLLFVVGEKIYLCDRSILFYAKLVELEDKEISLSRPITIKSARNV
jgi:hypothetical protein